MGELATTLTRSRQPSTRDWRMAAACRHTDPDLFFPVSSNGQSVGQMAQAKALCSGCSVRLACLQFALDTQADGVWGGMTEEERRLAMRQALRLSVERTFSTRPAPVPGNGGTSDQKGGWPIAHPVDKIQHACLLRAEGKSYGEISSETGIPKASLYRYLSRMMP